MPESISGALGRFHPSSVPGAEDVAEAVLSYPGGRVAHISASRVGQRKIRTMSIHDLDKLIEVDLLRRDVTIYRHVSDQPADAEGRGYRQQTVIEIPELLTSREPLAAQLDALHELLGHVARERLLHDLAPLPEPLGHAVERAPEVRHLVASRDVDRGRVVPRPHFPGGRHQRLDRL